MNAPAKMIVHHLVQGSPEWHEHRASCFNASDAAAMLGIDPHRSRTDLLDEMVQGYSRDASRYKQEVIFAGGHRREALARPLGEQIVGEDLYPLVGSRAWPALSKPLGASFDGLTMPRTYNWEHKQLNEELRAALPYKDLADIAQNDARRLHKRFRVQMEQQCMVSGCEGVLFTASDWDDDGKLLDARHCWYAPDPELRAEILAGWAQLEVDLATHVPKVHTEAPAVEKPEDLGALVVQVEGRIVTSNLAAWREAAMARIAGINRDLKSDEDFAVAKATVTWLADSRKKLKLLQEQVLGQMVDVNEIITTLKSVDAAMKSAQTDLDNTVSSRETAIRQEVAQRGVDQAESHRKKLNERLGRWLIPALTHPLIAADFQKAIKSKRTVKSLNDSVDAELARVKIALSAVADRIQGNLAHLGSEGVAPHAHLFPDQDALVLKEEADFKATCTARIAEARAAEERRLAAERERIRAEEAQRLEREQEVQRRIDAIKAAGPEPLDQAPSELIASAIRTLQSCKLTQELLGERLAEAAHARITRLEQLENAHIDAVEREQAAARASAPAATPAPTPAPTAAPAPALAASAPAADPDPFTGQGTVVPLRPAAPAQAPRGKPTLKLGTINERLAPLQVTADGLAQLGFQVADVDRGAKLFHEADFPLMVKAAIAHLQQVGQAGRAVA